MSFMELAQKRCSVRQYKDMPVEENKIKAVLEAGRIAPSACNKQPWYFVVVRDQAIKDKLAKGSRYIAGTPALIVVCGDHSKSWKRSDGKDHCDVDASIAVDHMTLQAADLGLGTCWVCVFDAKTCSEALELPSHIEPIAIIRLGYPMEETLVIKDRKELDEIVCWDRFDK